jgi:nicotinamidase/pyrazinamidase
VRAKLRRAVALERQCPVRSGTGRKRISETRLHSPAASPIAAERRRRASRRAEKNGVRAAAAGDADMPATGETDILIVVDVQNDFCPGGALAVPGGDDVPAVVNALARKFRHVALTQDWHPPGHTSFASSHPGRGPYETIRAPYGDQILWPDHCVQGSGGAAFHPALDIPHAALVLRKGFHAAIDSYSAFYENDRTTPTGLNGYLRERGFRRIFLAGLAFDFCVLWSAEDARRHGFEVVVIEDACRSIDLSGSHAVAHRRLAETGVGLVPSEEV